MTKKNAISYIDQMIESINKSTSNIIDNKITILSFIKEITGDDSVEYKELYIIYKSDLVQNDKRPTLGVLIGLRNRISNYGMPPLKRNNFLSQLPDEYVIGIMSLICIGCFLGGQFLTNSKENKLYDENELLKSEKLTLNKQILELNNKLSTIDKSSKKDTNSHKEHSDKQVIIHNKQISE